MAKPIYQRIVSELEQAIMRKKYQPGRQLPSVRDLCRTYRCSQSTAVKVYETLKSKHLVYSVPQSGYYVVENLLHQPERDGSAIDFSTGNPMGGAVHTPDLKHCLDRAVDLYRGQAIDHDIKGVTSLRALLASYLADFQVFAETEHILVSLGAQPVLSILTQMPFPNGQETVLVEQPTYGYYLDFLKFSGSRVQGVARDRQGIDLERLESLFRSGTIKFFYTVPHNHNPLGTAYRRAERKRLAELAARYDVYIVEDDYFGDVMSERGYDPVFAEGDHRHHIYLKTFTKILPWLRIGLVVLPAGLLPTFEKYIELSYYYSYFTPSLISQATLEIYIRSNLLKKHAAAFGKELSERLRCLERQIPLLTGLGAQWTGGGSGPYSYLKLPPAASEGGLIAALRARRVLVAPGDSYYLDRSFYEKGIRLSIARIDGSAIERGVAVIAAELRRQLAP